MKQNNKTLPDDIAELERIEKFIKSSYKKHEQALNLSI